MESVIHSYSALPPNPNPSSWSMNWHMRTHRHRWRNWSLFRDKEYKTLAISISINMYPTQKPISAGRKLVLALNLCLLVKTDNWWKFFLENWVENSTPVPERHCKLVPPHLAQLGHRSSRYQQNLVIIALNMSSLLFLLATYKPADKTPPTKCKAKI